MERRIHTRSTLHLPLWLLKPDWADPIRTQTENISNNGFFAFAAIAAVPGDQFAFFLQLPSASHMPNGNLGISIYGLLEVMRVSGNPSSSLIGLGCRLTEYRILPDALDSPTEDHVRKVLNSTVVALWHASEKLSRA